MAHATPEFVAAPRADALAVERLDKVFRIVSVVIVSLTILLVWNVSNGPSVRESQAVSVVVQETPQPLSSEWLWKRPDASFDSMYRTQR